MKKSFKTLFLITICISLLGIFSGCDNKYHGGIVKSYTFGREYETTDPYLDEIVTLVEIEVVFKNCDDMFYPVVMVVETYFEHYKCDSVKELFTNSEFIETYSKTGCDKIENGKTLFSVNKAFKNVSIYYYEGVEEFDELVQLDDLNNYIGYLYYEFE